MNDVDMNRVIEQVVREKGIDREIGRILQGIG